MLLHLSPDVARLARDVVSQKIADAGSGSKTSSKAIEKAQVELQTEHGLEISAEVLKQLGSKLGAQDPTLAQMKASLTARTKQSVTQLKQKIGTGLTDAINRLADSANGPPQHLGELVSPRTYHAVTAKKLKNADLLWVNKALLVESGIATPAQASNPKFKQALLDAFAYSVPRDEDAQDRFESGDEKSFAADYQGGEGNWGTLGSGRAMSAGAWQIKGGGDTSLSLKSGSKIGGLDLTTGISEAIFGEVNSAELPFGGNRILALIATGTTSKTSDGKEIPRILAVRQDPLRPSKYMLGELDRVFDPESLRAKENIALISNALPGADAVDGSLEDSVRAGAEQYVRQVAQQYGASYAKRLYHGATSPSNAQMDGGWLDYDLQTAQPGYGKINVLFSEASFGENHTVKKLVVQDFLQDVFDNTDGLQGAELEPFIDLFDEVYEQTVASEMALLAGTPPAFLDKLTRVNGPALQLGKVLHSIAKVPLNGNRRSIHIDMDAVGSEAMPTRTNEYDVPAILTALSKGDWKSPSALSRKLSKLLPDPKLRTELATAYSQFAAALTMQARGDGVPARGLKALVQRGVEMRTKPMDAVYRPVLREKISDAIDAFATSDNPGAIGDLIDSTLKQSLRTTKDIGPYQLVLDQGYDAEGRLKGKIFNARTNKVESRFLDLDDASGADTLAVA